AAAGPLLALVLGDDFALDRLRVLLSARIPRHGLRLLRLAGLGLRARFQLAALLLRRVLVLLPGDGVLEFADAASHRLAQLRQALRAEDDQHDDEDDSDLKRSHVRHCPDGSGRWPVPPQRLFNAWFASERPGRSRWCPALGN